MTKLIHMTDECLCGSFARPGEGEELAFWFPAFDAQIRQLEDRVAGVTGIPEHRRRWIGVRLYASWIAVAALS